METRQRTTTSKHSEEDIHSPPSTENFESNDFNNVGAGIQQSTHSETHGKTNQQEDKEEEKNDSTFECNICLDISRDAVISLCCLLYTSPSPRDS